MPGKLHRVLWRLYLGLAVLLLVAAAVVRWRLPLVPFAYEDTWGYLYPALSTITGGAFRHINGRNFSYPLFLLGCLFSFRQFSAICVVQHLSGLATGGLLLASFQQFLRIVYHPRRRLPPVELYFLGFIPAGIFLFSSWTIVPEHTLEPEAIFPCAAILSILLNLCFIRFHFQEKRPRRSRLCANANIIVTSLLYALKPNFGFGLLFANLPLGLALLRGAWSWRDRLTFIRTGLLVALFCLWLPEFLLGRSDRHVITFTPRTLFVAHADIMLRQIDEDLAAHYYLGGDEKWLREFRARFAGVFPAARLPENTAFAVLGFNPDYFVYGGNIFGQFGTSRAGDVALARFCRRYFLRACLHHPVLIARKVARQLGVFYRFRSVPPAWTYTPAARTQDLGPAFRKTVACLRVPKRLAEVTRYWGTRDYLARADVLAGQQLPLVEPVSERWLAQWAEVLYLPILCAVLALALLVAATPQRAAFLPVLLTVLLLYSYNFGNCLTVSLVYSLEIMRYSHVQDAFTLLAELAGLFFCVTHLGPVAASLRRATKPRELQP